MQQMQSPDFLQMIQTFCVHENFDKLIQKSKESPTNGRNKESPTNADTFQMTHTHLKREVS